MIEQPKVVKSSYIKHLETLLALRAQGPGNGHRGLCEYLSCKPDIKAKQRIALQCGMLLVHYRTMGNTDKRCEHVFVAYRTMAGLLHDYHDSHVPAGRRAKLLEVAWAQVVADIRAIPAAELTAILRAYYSPGLGPYAFIPSLAEIFADKPDAVALKRLSLPASGQTTFTKRIMKIVGEK